MLRYEEVPVPEPGWGEVRIRVRAAAVNHRDLWIRQGLFGGFAEPFIPGSDAAGEVDALGPGVSGLAPGDRVVVNPGLSCGRCAACLAGMQNACPHFRIFDGTYAEYAVLPAANLLPMPSGLTFAEAASIGVPFITAEDFLTRSGLLPGQTVVVWAATGGLGLATVQLARLRGARVLAVTRDPGKAEALRGRQFDEVLLWDGQSDLTGEVRARTGEGPELVVDSLGSATFRQSLAMVRRGGTVVTVGATTGGRVELELGEVFRRRLTVLGAYLGASGILGRLLPLFARGVLQPVIEHTFPLEQADQAHEQLEAGAVFGKLILEPPGA
ncbi:MAG: alcohol dehydrogenase catalytic domain-containing protein [Firmicutes bacterium]|nr:alcohol dehydrogenase catalytic domain-containing protein [Bacillota bacterium]